MIDCDLLGCFDLLFVTNFYFKGTQQFTGCFSSQDWLCHPWPPFVYSNHAKKMAKGDKANYSWNTSCKLLCAYEVKVCNKYIVSWHITTFCQKSHRKEMLSIWCTIFSLCIHVFRFVCTCTQDIINFFETLLSQLFQTSRDNSHFNIICASQI